MLLNDVILYIENLNDKSSEKIIHPIPFEISKEIEKYQNTVDHHSRVQGKLNLIEIARILETPWNWEKLHYTKGIKPTYDYFEFSTSYAYNFIGIAASKILKVGIDIELFDPNKDYKFILDFLHPNEINCLKSVSDFQFELLRIWTKKEAYLKLIGVGIQDDLTKIDTTNFQNQNCFYTEITFETNLIISLATFQKCHYNLIKK